MLVLTFVAYPAPSSRLNLFHCKASILDQRKDEH
jgi:hypothetical protein